MLVLISCSIVTPASLLPELNMRLACYYGEFRYIDCGRRSGVGMGKVSCFFFDDPPAPRVPVIVASESLTLTLLSISSTCENHTTYRLAFISQHLRNPCYLIAIMSVSPDPTQQVQQAAEDEVSFRFCREW